MSSTAVVWPKKYDAGRKWILLHAVYSIAASTIGALHPDIVMKMNESLLALIEEYTGLPRVPIETPEQQQLLVYASAFSVGIGSIYLLYGGPWWNHGGKVLVEGSFWTRFMYILASLAFCFLTPYGSSLLFSIAAIDFVSIFLLKWAVGLTWANLFHGGAKVVNITRKDL